MADKTEEELVSRVESARRALADYAKMLEEYRLSLLPVKVGDVVRRTAGSRASNGKLFRVAKIEVFSGKSFWLYGNMQKKDGGWGLGEQWLGTHWEKVDAS